MKPALSFETRGPVFLFLPRHCEAWHSHEVATTIESLKQILSAKA